MFKKRTRKRQPTHKSTNKVKRKATWVFKRDIVEKNAKMGFAREVRRRNRESVLNECELKRRMRKED